MINCIKNKHVEKATQAEVTIEKKIHVIIVFRRFDMARFTQVGSVFGIRRVANKKFGKRDSSLPNDNTLQFLNNKAKAKRYVMELRDKINTKRDKVLKEIKKRKNRDNGTSIYEIRSHDIRTVDESRREELHQLFQKLVAFFFEKK